MTELRDAMLEREQIANRKKHWVRLVTACNSRCQFCLDMDTPRNVILPYEEVQAELRRGREELDADKVILSGGEATLHPRFTDLVRYARSIGYDRVQVVTNGYNLADKGFYLRCRSAGLGEITFSLHGHTEELHDRLTRHPGSFKRLVKGMVRAVRDPRGPIVNVDVVINKQNVAYLDKIIELCLSLGVSEFDLLHVIPQSEAFRERDALFYDVLEHQEVLHKVFRLNRHRGVTVWTNRFPVSYLEGLEDLIQDPHKMLDEVNGRRFHVRAYLDAGTPLECREPDRCQHCFIEPFCTTMDRVVERSNQRGWEVFYGEGPLPYGCTRRGMVVDRLEDGLADTPAELQVAYPEPIPDELTADVRLLATSVAHCEAWLTRPLPPSVEVEVHLDKDVAAWLTAHPQALTAAVRIHQPSHEHMKDAVEDDVRDPATFFATLPHPVRVSGLPACAAPGMTLVDPVWRLRSELFDSETGRIDIRALSRMHVREGYTAKSERCRHCPVTQRCDGLPINLVRDQGLALCRPLEGDWAAEAAAQLEARFPEPPGRIGTGRPVEPVMESLPGFGPPPEPPRDPLAILELERMARLEQKRAERAQRQAGEA